MSEDVYDVSGTRLRPLISLANHAAARARRRRRERFERVLDPQPGVRILDVGCGVAGWGPTTFLPDADVTGIDVHPPEAVRTQGLEYVQGDGRSLPFADGSFDIAYSNSVVEHIAREDRRAYAEEIRRVARRHWVQTPSFWFPIEPHALLPAAQFLPHGLRRRYWRASPRRIEWEESLELLRARQLAALFPDSRILRERVGPLTKSLIAVGPRSELG